MFKFIDAYSPCDTQGYNVVYETTEGEQFHYLGWYATKQEAIDEITTMLSQLTKQL